MTLFVAFTMLGVLALTAIVVWNAWNASRITQPPYRRRH